MLAKFEPGTIDPQTLGQIAATIARSLTQQTDIESDSEMIDLWIASKRSEQTRIEYRRDVNYFLAWMGGADLRQVTVKDLTLYQAACTEKGWKVATIKRRINAVRSLLKYAVKVGYLHTSPGESITLPADTEAQSIKSLSELEVLSLIALATGRDKVLLRLLYASAGRVSEVCGLKWGNCRSNTDGTGTLTLFGKGAKTRSILVSRDTWAEMEKLRSGADDDAPVFPSRKGKGHLNRSQVYRIVAAAAKSAGIPGNVSPHWFRHSHATHAIDRGVSLPLIQATLGHASISTTGRYLHANPKDSSGLHLAV
jgi:integrase/recombinase XerD